MSEKRANPENPAQTLEERLRQGCMTVRGEGRKEERQQAWELEMLYWRSRDDDDKTAEKR